MCYVARHLNLMAIFIQILRILLGMDNYMDIASWAASRNQASVI